MEEIMAMDEEKKPELDITVDFSKLKEENEDIVGWLYCPDTAINYPVVQGRDNSYYLTHTFGKESNSSGCLFVDNKCATDFSDMNTSIHGHHMKNGTMFASLLKYQNQEYFDQHPVIFLLTPDGNYEIDLFSAFTTSATSTVYTNEFDSSTDFMSWYYECMKKSNFKADVDVDDEAHIITLSTCEYSYDDARYVVLGRLNQLPE